MSVVSLAQKRIERSPHWEGECVCLGCRHEWHGVGPLGVYTSLECDDCGLPKGVVKNLFGAVTGDAMLTCNCGCEALTAYISGGFKRLRCMACGTDQTDAYFG